MNKKTQFIVGIASIAVGIIIIGVEIPDILNNKQDDLGMIIVGLLNILVGSIILGTSKRNKKKACHKGSDQKNNNKRNKAFTILGSLIILIAIVTAIIAEDLVAAFPLITTGFSIILIGTLVNRRKSKKSC